MNFVFEQRQPPCDLSFLSIVDGAALYNCSDKTSASVKNATIQQIGWHVARLPAEWFLSDQAHATTTRVIETIQCTVQYLHHRLRKAETLLEKTKSEAKHVVQERDVAFEEIVELRERLAAQQRVRDKSPGGKNVSTRDRGQPQGSNGAIYAGGLGAADGLTCSLCGNMYPSVHSLESHFRKRHHRSEEYAAMAAASASVEKAVAHERSAGMLLDGSVASPTKVTAQEDTRGLTTLREDVSELRLALARLMEQQQHQNVALSAANVVAMPCGALPGGAQGPLSLDGSRAPTSATALSLVESTLKQVNERLALVEGALAQNGDTFCHATTITPAANIERMTGGGGDALARPLALSPSALGDRNSHSSVRQFELPFTDVVVSPMTQASPSNLHSGSVYATRRTTASAVATAGATKSLLPTAINNRNSPLCSGVPRPSTVPAAMGATTATNSSLLNSRNTTNPTADVVVAPSSSAVFSPFPVPFAAAAGNPQLYSVVAGGAALKETTRSEDSLFSMATVEAKQRQQHQEQKQQEQQQQRYPASHGSLRETTPREDSLTPPSDQLTPAGGNLSLLHVQPLSPDMPEALSASPNNFFLDSLLMGMMPSSDLPSHLVLPPVKENANSPKRAEDSSARPADKKEAVTAAQANTTDGSSVHPSICKDQPELSISPVVPQLDGQQQKHSRNAAPSQEQTPVILAMKPMPIEEPMGSSPMLGGEEEKRKGKKETSAGLSKGVHAGDAKSVAIPHSGSHAKPQARVEPRNGEVNSSSNNRDSTTQSKRKAPPTRPSSSSSSSSSHSVVPSGAAPAFESTGALSSFLASTVPVKTHQADGEAHDHAGATRTTQQNPREIFSGEQTLMVGHDAVQNVPAAPTKSSPLRPLRDDKGWTKDLDVTVANATLLSDISKHSSSEISEHMQVRKFNRVKDSGGADMEEGKESEEKNDEDGDDDEEYYDDYSDSYTYSYSDSESESDVEQSKEHHHQDSPPKTKDSAHPQQPGATSAPHVAPGSGVAAYKSGTSLDAQAPVNTSQHRQREASGKVVTESVPKPKIRNMFKKLFGRKSKKNTKK